LKAVKCPVCKGRGRVKLPFYFWMITETCHGCGGLGWIEVREKGETMGAHL